MKTLIVSAAVLLAISFSLAGLLANGDFSDWTDPTKPAGWVVEDTTRAPVLQSSSPARSAPYAARITRMVAGTGNNYGLNQFVPVTPGQDYTLSAWYLNPTTQARGGIGVSWYTADTTFISSTGITYSDTTTTTWQPVSRVVTAPASAGFARTLFRVYGFASSQPGNAIYLDDADFSVGTGVLEPRAPASLRPCVLLARPNPSPGRVLFNVEPAAPARLEIFDMAGNLVETLSVPAGIATAWNPTDRAGNRLPAGIYFAQATGKEGRIGVTKLVLRP